MAGLFSKGQKLKGGKYLVQRRDGTVPKWPWFVLGASDPAAPVAIRAYADECERQGMDAEYVKDLRTLACDYEEWRKEHGSGDPDAPRHREDNPAIIALMETGYGS